MGCEERYLVLAILMAISVQACAHRFLISYAQGDSPFSDFKLALGLNEVQFSILSGPGFSFLFVISSIFMGYFSDRTDRKKLLLICSSLFSLTTLASAYVSSFWEVLILRLALGVFTSSIDLIGVSVTSEIFPERQRNMAMAVYGFGIYIGVSLSTLSLGLSNLLGWRTTFSLFGVVGLLNSLCLLFVSFPKAEGKAKKEVKNKPGLVGFFKESIAFCLGSQIMKYLLFACTVRVCAGYLIGLYFVNYVSAAFPDQKHTFAVAQAAITACAGITSTFMGGKISTWLETEKGFTEAKAMVPAIGVLIALPFEIYAWAVSENFTVMLIMNGIGFLASECWGGPFNSIFVEVVPAERKASLMAINAFLCTVIANVWIMVFGKVLDMNETNSAAFIGKALSLFVGVFYVGSFLSFWKVG